MLGMLGRMLGINKSNDITSSYSYQHFIEFTSFSAEMYKRKLAGKVQSKGI